MEYEELSSLLRLLMQESSNKWPALHLLIITMGSIYAEKNSRPRGLGDATSSNNQTPWSDVLR